ncbi:MAG: DNA recombination protein RmuC [Planctomycetota bacterium]|nr:DNA recombination protein RmuC [Planctomycetota bacterium]
MELLFAFLAGLGLASVAALVLRSRALADQAQTHRAELDSVRAEGERGLEQLRSAVTDAREAQLRIQGELETAHAVAARAEEAAKERADWLEAQKKEMEKTFTALSSKALESSNQSFLERATERMKPVSDQLTRLEKATQEMEKNRQEAYGSLRTQLGVLHEATESYRVQSERLSTALTGSSQARGRIGEVVLRNIAEFAGMTRHCDFYEQGADSSGQRPDMVVRVPDGGEIPVDAKFPLAAYDRANEAKDPEERARQLAQHARDLKTHVNELARRDYSKYAKGEVDFTVLFLPGDHLLAAAFDADAELQNMAFEKRVLITTPVTFVALLRTVGLYWRQHQLAENAQEIATEAKELMGRLGKFIEHFSKVGKGLSQALGAYNNAVGSYERRILPSGRRVAELQALPAELPDITAIDGEVRSVELPAPSPEEGDGGLLPLP